MKPCVRLPCGCKITDATVLAMCVGHAMDFNRQRLEQQEAYREYVNRMSLACAEASAVVRGPRRF